MRLTKETIRSLTLPSPNFQSTKQRDGSGPGEKVRGALALCSTCELKTSCFAAAGRSADVPSRSSNAISRLRAEPKGRVPVGHQDEGVGEDPVVPADDALHELEQAPGVVPAEQDGEPGDNHHHDQRNMQEEQHDVV